MRYILKWLLFSLAFVPILVNFDTLFPFIFTKTLLIRSAITLFWIIFAVWYFRERNTVKGIIDEGWRFFKNPLYIAVSAFILLMLLSTIFAVDPYKAFFGDIERGEGYLGILHFFGFFVASLLVFKKEDWATFFRFNLITGLILLVDSIGEISSGDFGRAQSLVGNPTFLAGYFLFVIFSAITAFFSSRRGMWWKIFSFLMIFGGILGVFLTGTRGAILGLFAGGAMSIMYFAIKGRGTKVRLLVLETTLQKIGITLLIFFALGLGAFVFTRDNALWQKIPGVDRFATITLEDNTIQTRLISAGISLNAVNPVDNGLHRLLIGYGQDNFNIAYNKHFNPEYFRYESLWFDRAHNKVFDVLVMNGVLGFIAYASIWLLVFYLAFIKIREKEYAVPIIFFGTAYFVQNIFVFDQISTWIPFFAFLAFTVFVSSGDPGESAKGKKPAILRALVDKILPYKLPIVGALLGFTLVAYTLVPYFQSIIFIKALQTGDARVLLERVDSFTRPYTYAQATIRNRLIGLVMPLVGNPEAVELVNTAAALQEEFLARSPYDPRDFSLLANLHRLKGNLGEPGAYEKAIKYEMRALELSPTRLNHLYGLGSLYADMGDFLKMQEYAGSMLALAPDVARTKILYSTLITREGSGRYAEAVEVLNSAVLDPKVYFSGESEMGILRKASNLYIDYFFQTRDEENFLLALDGARDLEIVFERNFQIQLDAGQIAELPPTRSGEFDRNVTLFKQGGWDAIVLGE